MNGRRAGVPVVLSRFVGRRAELEELCALMYEHRLRTIVGPGGCGKTRLAIETLRRIATSSPGGVSWVDLAPVTDPARVGETVATALGVLVSPGADPTRALVAALRDRQLVIGIDNCEHVVAACGDLVEALLQGCLGVSVLATSREPLALVGEAVWRVPPMAEAELMELFADRAALTRAGFVIDDANIEAVRTVCRRLDGIPLAVELAAAWVRALTPAEISAALDDRFRLLVGGRMRGVPRQQTLAASVEWSYGLLGADAQTLLQRLSVFSGGFTLAAVEAVCSDERLPREGVLSALGRLIDTSIVTVGEQRRAARYQLPETLLDFAAARLADADEMTAWRDHHLGYVIGIAEASLEAFDRADQDEARRSLDVEADNVRGALAWAFGSANHGAARRLAAALVRWWFVRGHAADGIIALQRALALAPDDRSGLQAQLWCGLALLAIPAGRLDLLSDAAHSGRDLAEELGDRRALARLSAFHSYEFVSTDYARAEELAREAQRLGEECGDEFAIVFGMLVQACALANSDRHGEMRPIADALYARCEARHERFGAAFSRSMAMVGEIMTGDVRAGIELGRHAVRLAEPLDDYLISCTNTANLAWALGVAGDVEEGLRLMDRVVRVLDAAGPDADVVDLHVRVGRLHLLIGDLDAAVAWLEAACAAPVSGRGDNWTVARALPSLAGALRRLGRLDEAAVAARRGADMAGRLGTWHLRAEALDELALAVANDDPGRSLELHHEALALRVQHGLRTHMSDSLDGLARLAAAAGEHHGALRLFAASDVARARSGYPRPRVDEHDHAAVVAASRAALGDEVAAQACREGEQASLDETVAHVTRMRGRRQRPSFGWASLTPTERAVVALIPEGLTNTQIGARLFVSRTTVKTHLSNIYAKVGVGNRAELASVAARRGELDDTGRARPEEVALGRTAGRTSDHG